MLRSAAAAARSPAAAVLRRLTHAGGREEAESVAYRMSMLRAPPVVKKAELPRNSCRLIGRLHGSVRPFGGSSDECPRAYTFLSVSSSSPRSSSFRVTLNLEGELAKVSLKHLKQNDLVYVSGILSSYHKVDPCGEKHIVYKVHVTDLNYVVDQNRRPQNDDNSSDKTSAMSTTDEILQEKKCIRLRLWQVFFANPYEWWDNRQSKPHFKCADFKHKDTGEKLWLLPDDPPWIRRQLELHDQEIAKNGHRDGRRTLKNDTWESRDFDSSPSQDLYSSDDDGLLHSSGV
ncbi:protein OSB1, mitochondrial-like [Oryza brachyantha]|uniref:protein OSB1, mitochondrial-like n=1 Tax=Oryza brachyantha TaxID=4533 RepID=UPI001ADD437D|nr:protein OSB1, mitochondrial-like [Oryza brachyantha]